MIARLSKRISSFFVAKNFVKQQDEEVYNYGFELLLASAVNFLALILISIFSHTILETALFILGFVPLRQVAGGYHAKTHLRCFLILLSNYIVFLAVTYFIPISLIALTTIASIALSAVLVFIFAPVEDKNKPLSEGEKIYLKCRSRIFILIYAFIIITGTLVFQNRMEFLALSLGVTSVSLSLVAAYIKGKLHIA